MPLRLLADVPAPAKLNLSLRVVGRRADGYHALDTVMVPIDWCDTLHFERRDDGAIHRHDLAEPLPDDDLCLRAARALRAAAVADGVDPARLGADISIEKRLPSGAGLGGGSSDAATVLLALNHLWGLRWPAERLLPIGLALGADVPFFVAGLPARARGIGEALTPIPHMPATWAVVKPPASLATRDVFASARVAALVAAAAAGVAASDAAARIAGFSERNDLQAAAEDLCPDVTRALALLRDAFGASRMTGSGSAVFAEVEAGAESRMPVVPSGWHARQVRSLAAHPLHGWV